MDTFLGKNTKIPTQYAPYVLCKIPREFSRKTFIDSQSSVSKMHGFDLWRCYELIWLDSYHIPEACVLEFKYDAQSEYLLESKSAKIYLSSLRNRTFRDRDELSITISDDLSSALETTINVRIFDIDSYLQPVKRQGICLDTKTKELEELSMAALAKDTFHRRMDYVTHCNSTTNVDDVMYTNTFRCNCPITEQPDLATVTIHYTGIELNKSALSIYLNSFEKQSGFHEFSIERILLDITLKYEASNVMVYGNYMRRGGIEINPYRANYLIDSHHISRTLRQ
ncbi:NADPH-dependent 7-cyano-7-deazaguanine reductase [Candidatus Fokinia solitaria]|uniref:NADPH-dependent 7-cyano-7-deazaguanine reductase n=1 Tax=Candidatus Fokinia solitaria TaxID=1802984 RepID=A0A2U8BRG7_9RICK|nr:hypothetical protein [Candidatus Fokinia solitaria]AWD32935.1 NADPH-dependent 7-cyano-7-deazaguanine reductase [Candidatus Fokinia solitaria]